MPCKEVLSCASGDACRHQCDHSSVYKSQVQEGLSCEASNVTDSPTPNKVLFELE